MIALTCDREPVGQTGRCSNEHHYICNVHKAVSGPYGFTAITVADFIRIRILYRGSTGDYTNS